MAESNPTDIARQLEMIKRGADEVVPFEEMEKKLRKAAATGKPLRVKYGIDPTTPDVHIGHLVPVQKMRTFQDLGHVAVLIIGDYTAQIGDPTGRDESREALTPAKVKANAERYVEQLGSVLLLDEAHLEVHSQTEWFGPMTLQDVIELQAKFTFAQLMAHDTFRRRLEQGLPLSLHELMYPVLQAYDSVAVRADVELGATEQKFNILCGRDLQRFVGQEPQVAILNPILVGTDGVNKMSKSLGNTIAVGDPPNEKFGKVMSIPDTIIANYYEFATDCSLAELADVRRKLDEKSVNPRDLKFALARRLVARFHGDAAAQAAGEEFERVFKQKQVPDEMQDVVLEPGDLSDGAIWIVHLLVKASMAKTSSEARRLVQGGGVRLGDARVDDVDLKWRPADGTVLQVGKRRFARILVRA
ncbi:MAG: tyrosine--tRNA ligase [Verrucomicrobia bacterium]|nr:tyrosine--tRNA ligase [Verrucomicrobiota bacterium]